VKKEISSFTKGISKKPEYPEQFKTVVRELSSNDYVQSLNIKNVEQILDLNLPSVKHISDIFGEAQVLILTYNKFEKYLDMAEFELTEPQISIIVERTIMRYPYFNFGDIDLMLRKGISGELGKIYDKVRIDTILGQGGWLEIYSNWQHRNKRDVIDKVINEYFESKGKDPIAAMNHYITEGIKKGIGHLHTRYSIYRKIKNTIKDAL